MKRILGEAGAQESGGGVPRPPQNGTMRHPDCAGCTAEEGAVQQPDECSQRRGPARPKLEDEIRLVADVRELVGDQRAAEHPQPLASRQRLERVVINVADDLGRDEDVEVELEAGEASDTAEEGVTPMVGLRPDAVLVHELAQQARMALLLANEELRDARQQLIAAGGREAARRAQQAAAVRLLAELKCRDGAGNEPALLGPQRIQRRARRTARLLRVVFEMIQPDPEIREHDNVRRRAWRDCGSEPGGCSGAIVANSGSGNPEPAGGSKLMNCNRFSEGRVSKRGRMMALAACALALTATSAMAKGTGTAVTPAAPRPALYRTFDMIINLQNLPRTYSCDQLWYELHGILLRLGAWPYSISITPYHCSTTPTGSLNSPDVEVGFQLPFFLQGAAARSAPAQAVERTIRLSPGQPGTLHPSDCQLMQQISQTMLASVPLLRIDSQHFDCSAPPRQAGNFDVTVTLPVAVKAPSLATSARAPH